MSASKYCILINSFISVFFSLFYCSGNKNRKSKKKKKEKGCFHLEIITETSININTPPKKGLGVRTITVTWINVYFPIDYTTNEGLLYAWLTL